MANYARMRGRSGGWVGEFRAGLARKLLLIFRMKHAPLGLAALVLLFGPLLARSQVVINEFLASNSNSLTDQDGEHSDWIELRNTGSAAVNLQGWSLTDDPDNLQQWRFPSYTLPGNAYVIVFASGKNRSNPGAQLHANFSIDVQGEYLALVQPDGATIASEFAPAFPRQARDVSYGFHQGGTYYFTTPTPGAPNTAGLLGLVADTRFSRDRGLYDAPFDLTITTTTAGATVYYTTNGTPPALTNGLVHAGPIRIAGTTVLRAAAFKTGYLPSSVDTQTYLFLDDVIRQSPDGRPPTGWPASWGANTVNYGMDPEVVNSPRYSATIKNDLKTIPSVSLVMDLNDLFGRSRGIYANPSQDGINWERPGSVEWIYPDGREGFQVNAGVRIRGGYSRSTDNPKHAFRLFFREEYGDDKLRFPLFGAAGADTFDALDLRTFQNYSWSFGGDSRGIFMRDQFSRDAQLAMGHAGERGHYCHLYINGQYWGLFNTCERPEASYGATYFGGQKEEYDVIKVAPDTGYTIYATDGNMEAWTRLWNAARAGLSSDAAYQKVQGNNPDGTPNPNYEVLLDVDNLIDYMLVILYGGNLDAPISNFLGNSSPNNFFALRNRNGREGFRFFAHDAEHTLLDVNQNRVGPFSAGNTLDKSNPQWIWQQCWNNPEFKIRMADRVHRHFYNGGVFTPEGARSLLQKRKAEIDRAVVAESARWGDSKRTTPLTRDVEWVAEVNRVVNSYMGQRTGIVLGQLRARNLYPTLAAPSFNQHGGFVAKGFQLSMSAPAGAIYYTLNGSDPRLRGGAISPAALVYSRPVTIQESTTAKARVWDGTTWSALNEADFGVIQTFTELVVTEVMFNPPSRNGVDGEEFEFIELKNVSAAELDLSGVHFTDGIEFRFPNGTKLGPGQFVVLVSNPAEFANQYPGTRVDGVYSGRFSNSGETVALAHAVGTPLLSFTYGESAPWPISADGAGFSLAPVNPNLLANPADPANWRASSRLGGSPGADDPPVNVMPVWINEILTHTDPPALDQIELFNPGTEPADISYWFLTDARSTPKKYQFPANTVVPPGGYRVVTEQEFNPPGGGDRSFRLDSHGEEIYLYSADPAGNLTGYSDGFSFGASANGISFGRHVTSHGEVHYPAQRERTFGGPNAGPLVGPVVINEVAYAPGPGDEEFVELKNITSSPVDLFDLERPTNTWQLEGVGLSFPSGSQIPAQGLALVVAGEPAVFRARYGVPAEVPLFGPYSGVLQDNGELLQLVRPDAPDLDASGAVSVPWVVVDAVRYNPRAPWPVNAAGQGPSLERINPAGYGNDPANWRARPVTPSPGFENEGNRVPRVDAGLDRSQQAAVFPFRLDLVAAASDDGQPNPPGALSVTWSQVSGPAPVTISAPNALATAVSFPGLGVYVLRVKANDGALESSDEITVTLERPPSEVAFVRAGAVWKYLDDGSNQGALWRTPDFNDVSWRSGQAELGYGDGGEKTVIRFGPDSSDKYNTYYFRHAFEVSNAASVKSLTVQLLRDDGGVVYLNGIEVFRSNMPGGDIGVSTRASSVVGGGDESAYFESSVNPSVLRDGRNVVAVEIHQANASSSDLGFDLTLTGLALPSNQAPVVRAGADLAVRLGDPAALQGTAIDDGLPVPPGQLTVTWSRVSGPGEVTFANASSAVTTAQFSLPGTYLLRLSATDGSASGQDDISITVTGDPFLSWLAQHFSPAELSDPSVVSETADPDRDGHNNRQEFIAGTDPKDPLSILRAEVVQSGSLSGAALTIRFQAMPEKTYTVQFQSTAGGAWNKLSDLAAQSSPRWVEVQDATPAGLEERFYRIITPRQP